MKCIQKKNKTTLMVGYIYLYNDLKKLKQYLNQNQLGKILFIKCIRENLGPIRSDWIVIFDLASQI